MTADALTAFSKIPPHLLIENAFGADMVGRLLDFALAHEGDFTGTTVGKANIADTTIRRSRVLRNFGELTGVVRAKFGALLPRAISALGMPHFVPRKLSIELAAHGDGDFYRRHIDTFVGAEIGESDRVLTGVYYFHAEPKAFTGGALRLHSLRPAEAGGGYVDIEPSNDSVLFFPAWAPHEVRPVSCPGDRFVQARFAINCWYNLRSETPPS
jgi:Rps23 Pro-64 3,4-dihydroxylase Tpa1-like proline 4-hydroxylase